MTVDSDFTVDTNTLHVDAANNRVGIGTNNNPAAKLETNLTTSSSSSLMNANNVNDVAIIRAPYNENPESTGNSGAKWGMRFVGQNDGNFGNGKSAAIYATSEDGGAGYNRSVGMSFHVSSFDQNHTERLRLNSIGYLRVGQGNPYVALDVQTSSFGNGVITRQGHLYTFVRNFVNTDAANNPITVFTWGYDHANWNNQYIKAEVFNEYYWQGGEGAWILDSQNNVARQLYENNSGGSWSSSVVQVNSNLSRRTWTWTSSSNYRTYGIRLTFRQQPVNTDPNSSQMYLF